MTVTAYPLSWPAGWPRTPSWKIGPGRFKAQSWTVLEELRREVERLGGRYTVISSNVPVRADGLPYADAAKRRVTDPGVAEYFERKGKQMVFACDTYDTPLKNARAISLTIAAIRGIERWGASTMLERSLSAFEALPAPKDWRAVLGINGNVTTLEIERRYRELARSAHPDAGGSHDRMTELNAAREAALTEIGVLSPL